MAQQYPDDDQYGEYNAGHYDQHMEVGVVEALDFHVQDSVRRFGAGSENPTPVEVKINEPGRSSYDPLEQTINAFLNDQDYEAFKSRKTTPSFQTIQNTTDESNSSDSDVTSTHDKPQDKRKRKAHCSGLVD
ncbi:hypothetical protein NDU88_009223 [Pleurodeles waltl]|uniref:Uncharacterized protein n=1 Tax=Pleurodeles waltl TaxID=8319 RepID=A0AAV7NYF1_PLEWA|nr:hypothetical protein NDU88_009223 [Pleurodeles waltl]